MQAKDRGRGGQFPYADFSSCRNESGKGQKRQEKGWMKHLPQKVQIGFQSRPEINFKIVNERCGVGSAINMDIKIEIK